MCWKFKEGKCYCVCQAGEETKCNGDQRKCKNKPMRK
jgi:hypothetical protein